MINEIVFFVSDLKGLSLCLEASSLPDFVVALSLLQIQPLDSLSIMNGHVKPFLSFFIFFNVDGIPFHVI